MDDLIYNTPIKVGFYVESWFCELTEDEWDCDECSRFYSLSNQPEQCLHLCPYEKFFEIYRGKVESVPIKLTGAKVVEIKLYEDTNGKRGRKLETEHGVMVVLKRDMKKADENGTL